MRHGAGSVWALAGGLYEWQDGGWSGPVTVPPFGLETFRLWVDETGAVWVAGQSLWQGTVGVGDTVARWSGCAWDVWDLEDPLAPGPSAPGVGLWGASSSDVWVATDYSNDGSGIWYYP